MSGHDITPLTKQQVFDNALFGIRSQGYRKSRDEKSVSALNFHVKPCQYRTVDETTQQTLKCGIGWSLPDEWFAGNGVLAEDLDFNSSGISTLLAEVPQVDALFAQCTDNFLAQVQKRHDDMPDGDGDDGEAFERSMAGLAKHYQLHYTAPEGAKA